MELIPHALICSLSDVICMDFPHHTPLDIRSHTQLSSGCTLIWWYFFFFSLLAFSPIMVQSFL